MSIESLQSLIPWKHTSSLADYTVSTWVADIYIRCKNYFQMSNTTSSNSLKTVVWTLVEHFCVCICWFQCLWITESLIVWTRLYHPFQFSLEIPFWNVIHTTLYRMSSSLAFDSYHATLCFYDSLYILFYYYSFWFYKPIVIGAI